MNRFELKSLKHRFPNSGILNVIKFFDSSNLEDYPYDNLFFEYKGLIFFICTSAFWEIDGFSVSRHDLVDMGIKHIKDQADENIFAQFDSYDNETAVSETTDKLVSKFHSILLAYHNTGAFGKNVYFSEDFIRNIIARGFPKSDSFEKIFHNILLEKGFNMSSIKDHITNPSIEEYDRAW